MPVPSFLQRRLPGSDWLRELQVLLIAGLVLTAVGLAGVTAMALWGQLPVNVPTSHVVEAGALQGLTGGVRLDGDGSIDLTIVDPTPLQSLLGALTLLPTVLVVLATLALLLRVVRGARREDPFTEATVRRLRQLGTVAIVGGLVAWVGEFVAQLALTSTVTETGWSGALSVTKPLAWLLVATTSLAVAEIVNRGQAMRAELAQVI